MRCEPQGRGPVRFVQYQGLATHRLIPRVGSSRLGREPPDAMSLCNADIEPPRFARQTEPPLCRQSLRYADRASAML